MTTACQNIKPEVSKIRQNDMNIELARLSNKRGRVELI